MEITDDIVPPRSDGYTVYYPGKTLPDFGPDVGSPIHEYSSTRSPLKDLVQRTRELDLMWCWTFVESVKSNECWLFGSGRPQHPHSIRMGGVLVH